MYLLYLDGSGSVMNPNERHFVLAGIAVFERQIFHLINSANRFVDDLGLGPPEDVELHASVMAGGRKGVWKGSMTRKQRLETIGRALRVLANAHRTVRAFGVVVDKESIAPDDPVETAFEHICNRFNLFLSRLRSRDDPHRGLIVMDKSHYEDTLQGLASEFREHGTRWGQFRNLAEVPMFVDSAATRLIQLADLLAWALWRRYELGDTSYLDLVLDRFDQTRGVLHGLVHYRSPPNCPCPACLSRRGRSPVGATV